MFTGIIQCVGTVSAIDELEHGQGWWVRTSPWAFEPAIGDSIAVNGCCLTVAQLGADVPGGAVAERVIRFDVIPQTLRVTALGDRRRDDRVNLEAPVTPTTLLSGHVVQGHIDGAGVVREIDTTGGEWRVSVAPPLELMPYIVEKGSIALDGVSLTVAERGAGHFVVALIPTTLEGTTLGALAPGARVNLETDYLMKGVVSYLRESERGTKGSRDQGIKGSRD